MAKETEIAWTRSTWNPWIGCQKVGPGCDNCYAEALDARKMFSGTTHFGARVPRLRTKEANWNQVRRWNKQAPDSMFAGRKGFWPVFCASLADVFDNEVDTAWREDVWQLIRECPNLTFQVLTKRIGNVPKMLPPDWGKGYPNVWLGATIVNQEEADRDIPKLLSIPAAKRFLSMEPLLGAVSLDCLPIYGEDETPLLHWIVVGGESGSHARPMHPLWVESLRDQCGAAGIQFLFKQWGEWGPTDADNVVDDSQNKSEMHRFENGQRMARVGKKDAGRLLGGIHHEAFP